jgi:hypothetical protein
MGAMTIPLKRSTPTKKTTATSKAPVLKQAATRRSRFMVLASGVSTPTKRSRVTKSGDVLDDGFVVDDETILYDATFRQRKDCGDSDLEGEGEESSAEARDEAEVPDELMEGKVILEADHSR